jgi:hypothetical protein
MKFSRFAVVILLAFLPLMAAAQLASFSFGGPVTTVTVLNNTNDGTRLIVTIGNKSVGPLGQGQEWGRRYGFSNAGDVPILIKACSLTDTAHRFNSAPDWATNVSRFGSMALTDEFLRGNPSRKDVEVRVKAIKTAIHNHFEKEKEAELSDWFNTIKGEGILLNTTTCGEAITMPFIALHWQQWYGYGQNTVTMITVSGNRESGYRIQNPPQYVY